MKYTYESQKNALKYLIENVPHDMEKFKSLYNVEVEGKNRAKVPLPDILFSFVWTASEKVQLIKLYGYNDEENYEYRAKMDELPLIDACIKNKNFSGVQALLSLDDHISVATIRYIIKYIDDPSERYKFCELIVNHYKDKENIKAYTGAGNQCHLTEIPSLCDRYPEYIPEYISGYGKKVLVTTVSSMKDICSTNDLELVKLFLPTAKNINPLFMFAVKSKNIEMVKLFIKAGADVNFQDLEFECDYNGIAFKTPIKIAIDNNDLEMVKFLHQNGADLDFVDKSKRIQEFIDNLGKEEVEKETHRYKDYWDRRDYIIWTKTPLEYAITLGVASIINNSSTRKNNSFEKQFKGIMDIVKYLYENGATFGEGQINYTDLICFAIKSDDFSSTKYYFEEALKKDSKLDFVKIINFIHNPGVVKTDYYTSIHYKTFEEGANPWFRLCEEYSKKIDSENHNRNIKLMLEKLFSEFSFNDYQFNKYRDVITNFSKALPKDILKDIPAIFGVSLENLEDVLSLGYDINSVKNNENILMYYIIKRYVDIEIINKLTSLGANINYQDPISGNNALSCIIAKLPQYDFRTYVNNFNLETGQLDYPPEAYESKIKSLVKAIINLSNQEVIMSESVKVNVCRRIEPGYPQIIYNEILEALSKRGFKVDDDYVTKSITCLNDAYFRKYVTNLWGYLWNLYSNFPNKSVGTNHEFPKIESAKNFKYGTEQSNNLFALIREHLKRNFAISVEEIQEPDKIVNEGYYYKLEHKYESRTALQAAQDQLLSEISRYIGNLDYRQIITLIDNSSLIDIESITRNKLLPIALKARDKKLCRQLIKRGATIVCYDENGHDVTSEEYSAEQIDIFLSLNKEYNPNQECEDLLSEIGCGEGMLSKKMKPVKKS